MRAKFVNESMYYPGFQEAKDSVYKMSEQQLLDHIDGLYGRENLPEDYTLEELRLEAIEQTRKDFLTPDGEEEHKFLTGYADAMKSQFKK